MKKVLSIITILAFFLTGNSYTFASEKNVTEVILSDAEITSIKVYLSEYDVSKETQDDLIYKLESGEKWDSLKGINPVSTHTIEKSGTEEKVETFPDGSISVSGMDLSTVEESSVITPYDLDPGDISSGSGYTSYRGAKVYRNTGVLNASFYADFTQVNGGMSYITRVYDERVFAIGGSVSEISLNLVKSREDLNYPAEAKLSFIVTIYPGGAGANAWLKLQVGNGHYSTPSQF